MLFAPTDFQIWWEKDEIKSIVTSEIDLKDAVKKSLLKRRTSAADLTILPLRRLNFDLG
ncbi:MAG: hypothetical protein L6V93_10995 [Clostridiales bacterium]|nr:MAG: hypothetical protein L6V93_10995 [Clostridiales bacterium]